MPPPHDRLSTTEWVAAKAFAVASTFAFLVILPPLLRPHWAAFVDAFGGAKGAFVYGTGAVHLASSVVCNLAFAALYVLRLPAFERWKTNGRPWPWEQGPEASARIKSLIGAAVIMTLLNNVIGTALAFGNYDVLLWRGLRTDDASWPSAFTLFWQIVAFMFCEDLQFYFTHRMLHAVPWLYQHVHRLHHRYTFSLSIAAEFTHPLEYVLGNGLPFLLGPLLVGNVHLFTLFAWLVVRIVETCDGHSGYDLPWMPQRLIPFASCSAAHDAHHAINTGNYGSFTIVWDTLLGTTIPEDVCERSLYAHREAGPEGKKA